MAKKISFKEKSADELAKLLMEKREELRTLRFSFAGSRGKDSNAAGKTRKDVARILTEMTAKKIA
ncbi:MAG: ribosomal protein [Parcubacteria group bacterium]|nr:ribosomal protein [Parcubacteria group bacterium]